MTTTNTFTETNANQKGVTNPYGWLLAVPVMAGTVWGVYHLRKLIISRLKQASLDWITGMEFLASLDFDPEEDSPGIVTGKVDEKTIQFGSMPQDMPLIEDVLTQHDLGSGKQTGKPNYRKFASVLAREVRAKMGPSPKPTDANRLVAWELIGRGLNERNVRKCDWLRYQCIATDMVFTPTVWDVEAQRLRDSLPVADRLAEMKPYSGIWNLFSVGLRYKST